jgi:hypothetical protein
MPAPIESDTISDIQRGAWIMLWSIRVLVVMMALVWIVAGVGSEAHALGKHKYRQKKNSSPYAYLAPKKTKKPTGYYRSTLTGQVVYGKKKNK